MAARGWRLAGAALGALLIGMVAGNATVTGMASVDTRYVLPLAGDERSALAEAAAEREAVLAEAALTPAPDSQVLLRPAAYDPDQEDALECADCGDHEAGYRWAAERGVADATDCLGDSASFARGCAAYVAGERPRG